MSLYTNNMAATNNVLYQNCNKKVAQNAVI